MYTLNNRNTSKFPITCKMDSPPPLKLSFKIKLPVLIYIFLQLFNHQLSVSLSSFTYYSISLSSFTYYNISLLFSSPFRCLIFCVFKHFLCTYLFLTVFHFSFSHIFLNFVSLPPLHTHAFVLINKYINTHVMFFFKFRFVEMK